MDWKNRIVEQRQMPVAELHENPHNWRLHPTAQEGALSELLSEVGIVQGVVFNRRTGRLVDGHLRVKMAAKAKLETLPVTVVDLSEDEEKLVLATLDPVSAMADVDWSSLRPLIDEITLPDGPMASLIAAVAAPFQEPTDPAEEWGKIADFASENQAHRSITVHFRSDDSVEAFCCALGLTLSKKVKYTWFPPEQRQTAPEGNIARIDGDG